MQLADFGREFPGDYDYPGDEENASGQHNGATDPITEQSTSATVTSETPVTPRKRFGPDEDYLLAIQVNKETPFKAKFGSIRKEWQKVADTLNASPNFNMLPIQGTTAQARFEALLVKHKKWEASSKRASGSNEEETQYIKVLTDLTQKVNDHKADKAKSAAKSADAESAKVLAGDVVRAAAVTRLQLGKRSGSDAGDVSQPSRTKTQKVRPSELSSVMQDMETDRSRAMDEFLQMQKAEMEQRNLELRFDREEREKEREERRAEREERQQERQLQQELLTNLLRLLEPKQR
ncbi:hypothetical protein PHMEG_00029571 [Phytophthora megakarya]|uniref:Uncharacterized protein n=1 Tax=Phytophthora megakarya TaxID=4795 RepID=A0A225V0T0_9STRA|nr:hypothetical protein PHMEG_00029571 [Phytophthora megakarya]